MAARLLAALKVPRLNTVVAKGKDWDDEPPNDVAEAIDHDLKGATEEYLCQQARGHVCWRLTPELSRTDLRPWASETCKNLHEAAKRARLERIVRPVPAVLLTNELI